MALPGNKSENKPSAAKTDANIKENPPVNPTSPAVNLSFEDADAMPEAKELNQSSNPFQEKVNELARTGKAAAVVVPVDQESWARSMIRRAANNIDKGARTKVQKVDGQDNMRRIWFKIGKKVERSGTSS